MHAKRRLRAEMRARRSALSTAYRHSAALGLYRSFRRHPLFLRAASIAGYFPMGGELDPGDNRKGGKAAPSPRSRNDPAPSRRPGAG